MNTRDLVKALTVHASALRGLAERIRLQTILAASLAESLRELGRELLRIADEISPIN